ncbi:MAG: arginine--tRNA ligase [Candidatus Omnitrophica bacterium]|nr:arginine--tRNA ligase [Candidatus Omnitrophota bacterium]
MHGKDTTKKIEELLFDSSKLYFDENVGGTGLPEGVEICLQPTRDKEHGDLACNLAMRLARSAKRPPAEIASGIVAVLKKSVRSSGLAPVIDRVEAKGGFINFSFSAQYYGGLLKDIYGTGRDFGRSDIGCGKKVNLEFVSANPTGPLTIAHGRQAAIGDTLSRILKFTGHAVTNEYYLNDAGRQINMLGRSVQVRYMNLHGRNEPMPEDGYMGDYITEIAERVRDRKKDTLLEDNEENGNYFREYAVKHMMALIEKDLEDFGVEFDEWTSQEKLEARGEVPVTLDMLRDRGYVFEKDGAVWFKTTELGDDKDRVVVKSDGSYTYLAPDIAYHRDKYARGYELLIDLLGPDHHGYIKRMKAAVRAMGRAEDSLKILIVQLVTLMRGDEALSMSTRKGEFLSLREILDELGKDVTRFFFLSRKLDSHLDFDIELAKKESSDNPVFYIQYAHARICSIHKFCSGKGPGYGIEGADTELLTAKEEGLLVRKLAEFPLAVKASAEALEPNRLIVYLNELARVFHSFYTECRVVNEEDPELTRARLFLVECARIVLANGLGLLNITLPERM